MTNDDDGWQPVAGTKTAGDWEPVKASPAPADDGWEPVHAPAAAAESTSPPAPHEGVTLSDLITGNYQRPAAAALAPAPPPDQPGHTYVDVPGFVDPFSKEAEAQHAIAHPPQQQGPIEAQANALGNTFAKSTSHLARGLLTGSGIGNAVDLSNYDKNVDSAIDLAAPIDPTRVTLPARVAGGAAPVIGTALVGGPVAGALAGAAEGVGSAKTEGAASGLSPTQTNALATERGILGAILGLIPGGRTAQAGLKGAAAAGLQAYGLNVGQAVVENHLKQDLGISNENDWQALKDAAASGDNVAQSLLMGGIHHVVTKLSPPARPDVPAPQEKTPAPAAQPAPAQAPHPEPTTPFQHGAVVPDELTARAIIDGNPHLKLGGVRLRDGSILLGPTLQPLSDRPPLSTEKLPAAAPKPASTPAPNAAEKAAPSPEPQAQSDTAAPAQGAAPVRELPTPAENRTAETPAAAGQAAPPVREINKPAENRTSAKSRSASDVLLSRGVSDGVFPNDFEREGDNRAALHPDTVKDLTPGQKQAGRGLSSEDRFTDATAGMNAEQRERYERSTEARFTANKDQRVQEAIDHYKSHPDPNLRRLAAYADAEGTGPKRNIPVEQFHDGDTFELGGRKFTVQVDPDGSTHFLDHDIDIPHADALPDGKMKIDTGTWEKVPRAAADEPFAPPEPKTTSSQGSLLGERYEGSSIGSKTGSMFGDVRPGPASELEAKGNDVGQAEKDKETQEMFGGGDAIGQRGLSSGPPGAIQIAPLVRKAAETLSLGEFRGLRERFAPIEGRYGSDIAKAFIKTVAAPKTEAETLSRSFFRQAFGKTSDPEQYAREWTDLARFYRLRDLQARNPGGNVGAGLPMLPASEVARLEADPVIQQAHDLYNKQIAPLLTDIRQRNGMLMNPAAGNRQQFPVFVNLPGEYEGPAGTDTRVNPNLAFNKAATGNQQLKMDPIESLAAAIRGHLASDYKQELVKTIKGSYAIPQQNLVPSASGRGWEATFRGRTVPVDVIDVAPKGTPAPDLQYVPRDIAKQYNKIEQERGEFSTLLDKAIQFGTKVTLVGDLAPHSARVVSHVAARMAQSGYSYSGALPSWLGSNEAAIGRMREMVRSPLGETLQLLIDRSGADKGGGFDVKTGQNAITQLLGKPHDLLFNPEYGIDPMARRVVADAHLRTLLGNQALDKIEQDLAGGRTTPVEASSSIEKQLSDAQFVGLGRKVNGTLGFANKQTRSGLVNAASRIFPFISSESGMIPRELTKLVNLDIPALKASARRGEWAQGVKQMAGMLATGAVGVYLASNVLNFINTKAQTGQGNFLWDNEDGHKLDVFLAPGWYLSNLDPTFSRATRLSGVKGALNGDGWLKSTSTEAINEPMSMLASTAKAAFATATYLATKGATGQGQAYAPQITVDNQGKPGLLKTSLGQGLGVPIVRNTAAALEEGKPVGEAVIKDAASLAGLQVKHDSPDAAIDSEYYKLEDQAKKDQDRQEQLKSLARQISAAERGQDWKRGAELRKERTTLIEQPRALEGRGRARLEQLRELRTQLKTIQQRIKEGSMTQAAGDARMEQLRARARSN